MAGSGDVEVLGNVVAIVGNPEGDFAILVLFYRDVYIAGLSCVLSILCAASRANEAAEDFE